MNIPIQSELRGLANPEKAKVLSGFFKTGNGQYGEGDVFLGIQVPETRRIVKKYLKEMDLGKVEQLLESTYHEERLSGVHTLVEWAKTIPHLTPPKRGGIGNPPPLRGSQSKYSITELGEFYLSHRDRINNWDLVDTSAPYIIGPYLETLSEKVRANFIEQCIRSTHLWTNRIIVLASFYHINKLKDETLTFSIVTQILNLISENLPPYRTLPSPPRRGVGGEELIYKACGWMLREVGKRVSEEKLCEFLDLHAKQMPRTMLRYAIERLDKEKKEKYMKR